MLGFLKNLTGLKDELEMDLEAIINEQKEPPASRVMLQMLTNLMRRKKELYPNDERVIMDFELTETATDRHLTVSSIISGTDRNLH